MRAQTVRLGTVLLLALMLSGGCSGERAQRKSSAPSRASTPERQAPASAQSEATSDPQSAARKPSSQSCTHSQLGHRLNYPGDWFTNSGEVASSCQFFGPQRPKLEPQTENFEAINLRRARIPFQRYRNLVGAQQAARLMARGSTQVDGHPALVVEACASG